MEFYVKIFHITLFHIIWLKSDSTFPYSQTRL
jgi:hypothetical protein